MITNFLIYLSNLIFTLGLYIDKFNAENIKKEIKRLLNYLLTYNYLVTKENLQRYIDGMTGTDSNNIIQLKISYYLFNPGSLLLRIEWKNESLMYVVKSASVIPKCVKSDWCETITISSKKRIPSDYFYNVFDILKIYQLCYGLLLHEGLSPSSSNFEYFVSNYRNLYLRGIRMNSHDNNSVPEDFIKIYKNVISHESSRYKYQREIWNMICRDYSYGDKNRGFRKYYKDIPGEPNYNNQTEDSEYNLIFDGKIIDLNEPSKPDCCLCCVDIVKEYQLCVIIVFEILGLIILVWAYYLHKCNDLLSLIFIYLIACIIEICRFHLKQHQVDNNILDMIDRSLGIIQSAVIV